MASVIALIVLDFRNINEETWNTRLRDNDVFISSIQYFSATRYSFEVKFSMKMMLDDGLPIRK